MVKIVLSASEETTVEIHDRIKCTKHKTPIKPIVLYGHKTLTMLEEDLQLVGVFERQVLRIIFVDVEGNSM